MNKILVTPRSLTRSGHPAFGRLKDAGYEVIMCTPGTTPDETELKALLPECVGWLAGVEPVTPEVIDAAARLRVISRNGTGVDNLPLAYLEQKGICLKKAAGTNARGVAELALGLMLAGLRHIVSTSNGVKEGFWPRVRGLEINGRTVGLVGCGAIGGILANLCVGVGARVLAYDPYPQEKICESPAFAWENRDTVLKNTDILSLHCPLPADGSPILGQEEMMALRDGAIVVNTARAGLVNELAMLAALESGKVSVFATDVFETEPPALSPLHNHPNTILTSHIGAFTVESVERSVNAAVDNLLKELGTRLP